MMDGEMKMATVFIHHANEGLNDVRFPDFRRTLRKSDVVVLLQRYYVVEHCQHDPGEGVSTYWLGESKSEHPSAPR